MIVALSGQFALVTGANSGIGRACALELARAGAGVAVNYMTDSGHDAQAVVREIEGAGGRAIAIAADVGRQREVERMFAEIQQAFGALHILVSSAWVAPGDMSPDEWGRALNVDLTGQFLCAQQAVRLFDRRADSQQDGSALGKIIYVGSAQQAIPWSGNAHYAATKAGIRLFMETLAQELGPKKIRVNAVAPGIICTSGNCSIWARNREKLLALIPYGRVGTPQDVARAVLWLASDESDYVTGSTLVIDGGMMHMFGESA